MWTRIIHSPNTSESIINDRDECKDGDDTLLLVWFTYSSKTNNGTGAGIHRIRPVEDLFILTGKNPTVFEAENCYIEMLPPD